MEETYLQTLTSDDGLRIIFTIIFIATLLTVYEIIMFYAILIPSVKKQVDKGIDNAVNNIQIEIERTEKTELDVIALNVLDTSMPHKKVKNIAQIMNEREARMVSKINIYTFITGIILFALLSYIMIYIYFNLKGRGQKIGTCTFAVSIFTIILLFSFQYSFYKYGTTYRYLGTEGNEELIVWLLKSL